MPIPLRFIMAHVYSPLIAALYHNEKSWELEKMVASQSHNINQLKWFYSALTGVCAAYFFALFSGQVSISGSYFLQASTLLFAMCIPLFTTFAIVHILFIESNLPSEVCETALKQKWVTRLTRGALLMFITAFGALIGHFSVSALLGAITMSICCFFSIKLFFKEVKNNMRDK